VRGELLVPLDDHRPTTDQ